jgi:hypothetical protein
MIIQKFRAAWGDDNPDHLHNHHLVPRSCGGSDDETNLITLSVECHGKMHGVKWHLDHKNSVKSGVATAKAKGIKVGRPKLPFEIRQKIVQRSARGESPYAIAKALGIDKHTAAKYAE